MKASTHPTTAMDAASAHAAEVAPEAAGAPPLTPLAHSSLPPDAAFDRLVEEHHARVVRLAYRLLGWRDEVEDVAQEVFLAALRGWPKYRGESRVSTWLTAITIRQCRRWRRKRLLRLRWLLDFMREPRATCETEWKNSPLASATADPETFERVRAALRALPARECEVVVLRYLEQLSVDEIGEILGARRNAVEVRLHRARRKLKDTLGDWMENA